MAVGDHVVLTPLSPLAYMYESLQNYLDKWLYSGMMRFTDGATPSCLIRPPVAFRKVHMIDSLYHSRAVEGAVFDYANSRANLVSLHQVLNSPTISIYSSYLNSICAS